MSRVAIGSDGGRSTLIRPSTPPTRTSPTAWRPTSWPLCTDSTREAVDRYAMRSQQRAATARAEGRFARSLIPVRDVNGEVVLA